MRLPSATDSEHAIVELLDVERERACDAGRIEGHLPELSRLRGAGRSRLYDSGG